MIFKFLLSLLSSFYFHEELFGRLMTIKNKSTFSCCCGIHVYVSIQSCILAVCEIVISCNLLSHVSGHEFHNFSLFLNTNFQKCYICLFGLIHVYGCNIFFSTFEKKKGSHLGVGGWCWFETFCC